MTTPTKAIVPYMLEDFRRVAQETKENKETSNNTKDKETMKELIEKEIKNQIYSIEQIKECIKKVIPCSYMVQFF